MSLEDFSLNDVPIFHPDVENWSQVHCDYNDMDSLPAIIKCASFALLLINIRSCRKNFNQFLAYFCNFLTFFSCIILTETWLTADLDNVFSLSGFYCHNLYRNGLGGGIKLYVKNSIQSRILNEFTFINDLFEILSVELLFGNRKAVLTSVYHPPTSSIIRNNDFIESLAFHLGLLVQMKLPLIVAGDMNINLLNPHNNIHVNTFVNSLFELGLSPLINIPTKVNIGNAITRFSILDHIWMSGELRCDKSFVIPVGITDHFPVGVTVKFPFRNVLTNITQNVRPLRERGKTTFRILLSNIQLNVLQDFNSTYNDYLSKLFEYYNAAFPVHMRTNKPKQQAPWMTPRLRECIRKKAKLYKLYLKGRITRGEYTLYKNRLTSLLRRVKRLHYSTLLFNAASDSRKVWSHLNDITERNKGQSLKEIRMGDIILYGRDLVNYANNFFINAVTSITNNLIPSPNYNFLTAPIGPSCFFYPTTPTEVMKIIKNLKNKGNKLLDIHISIIKDNLHVFSDHLAWLYNMSLDESTFPDKSKVGRVTPAHKGGSIDNMDNYRPITVLPLFSKIFEKLTLVRMQGFISRHNILTPCQYGFRVGRSTTHAVMELLSYITKAYHDKIYCACFFLDLRKAFDTVHHNLLLQKLQHYGFRGHCHSYLKSYYDNRKQYVHLNGCESDIGDVLNGVPQGSILGPLCFNLFINDLPLAVKAHTVLFADDAAFIITASTLDDLYSKIEELFCDIANYLHENRLVPNSTKSKLMMFSSRPTHDLREFTFAGEVIQWVKEFKYLGLTITDRLCFSNHINKVALNISRIAGVFSNVRSVVPFQIMMKLYYALAFPHLINHVVIWGAAPQTHLKPLSVRLNNILRIILGVEWVDGRPTIGTNVMYETNNLLKVKSIFKYYLFKLLRQLLDGNLPDVFNMLLEPYVANHPYGTRGNRFRHPPLVCEVERRWLSHQLILLYDEVPREILNQNFKPSMKSFKIYLLNNQ